MAYQRERSMEEFDQDSAAEVEELFVRRERFGGDELWKAITVPLAVEDPAASGEGDKGTQ